MKRSGVMVNKTIAFLWDESFLWGLMSYKALKACNLSFELIRSDDIKKGELKNYRMLFVPGGWASNKMKTLGEKGIGEIKNFVNSGGNYLGFCGGAGLATLDGIGLLNINRMPTKQRVPSFSGRIHLNINGHPIWNSSLHHSITPSAIFHAWWPSQFLVDDTPIKILATYGDALSDSFSSDLNVGDVEANGGWSELEDIYKINLNPRRLKDAPSVVEGSFGKGKVILSLIHFDTPDDTNGARVLKNLWEYLSGQKSEEAQKLNSSLHYSIAPSILADLESAVDDLISLGTRNFLWFWKNPMLLQWRRGVRGLEYCTLYVMIKEIAEIIKKGQWSMVNGQKIEDNLKEIRELLMPFIENAKRLLILERYAMQNGHITPLSPPLPRGEWGGEYDPEIQKIRTGLFGNSKSHGGLFKKLIDEVDSVLYALIDNKL
jgi:glutamine amidotransferase-like uncharacterized protein